ncbi:MAG: DUF5050 domain-containing protein [Lachnospiraceae bacterium]|nr:DUF5050 domain-containing protein [Lachnospiraceae bacterium]
MKNLKPIIVFVIILIIAGALTLLSYQEESIPANPDGTIGNTAGNLNNGGLFCEHEGRVYFSNPADNNCLYSMNIDETDVKKVYDGNICNILAGGDYLYYFMREPVNTSLDKLRVSHAFFRSNLNGEKVKNMTRDVVVHAQLVNDSLYLLTTAGNNLCFYRMNTDQSDKTILADYAVNPSCAKDGVIYYNGTQTNHYLNSLNTENNVSTVFWEGNIWYPVLDGNYFYYLDVENDYRLCRYDYTQEVIEVLTHDRVECFNIGSGYLYYQSNSQTEPALKRMRLNGSDLTVIAKGNYTAIHMTSNYVYFKEFGEDNWYHSPIGSDTYSSMWSKP